MTERDRLEAEIVALALRIDMMERERARREDTAPDTKARDMLPFLQAEVRNLRRENDDLQQMFGDLFEIVKKMRIDVEVLSCG